MFKVGDTIPSTTLMEFFDTASEGCSLGPNPVDVAKASAGKTIAVFALPGAFTPTCSAKHVPGYVENFDAFKAAGFDGTGHGLAQQPLLHAGKRRQSHDAEY
jgi:peroxiredoxin